MIGGAVVALALGLSGGFRGHVVDEYRWLSDFVLADIDGDGRLDISTTNHAMRPRFLLNKGEFGFVQSPRSDRLAGISGRWALVPNDVPPDMSEPGLYVFYTGVWVRFVGRGLDSGGEKITLLLPFGRGHESVSLVEPAGAVGEVTTGTVLGRSSISFGFDGDFSISLAPSKGQIDADALVVFPPAISPGDVHLGSGPGSGTERLTGWELQLSSRYNYYDWHGVAWADVNSDGVLDLYVNQGGLAGLAPEESRLFNDLLMISGPPDGARDIAWESGVRNFGRPGRGVSVVDADRDGLLDFYVTNSRPAPPRRFAPNVLNMQHERLRFRDEAAERGVAIPAKGRGEWFDVDGDGWVDLLWGDSAGVRVFVNESGSFRDRGLVHSAPLWASGAEASGVSGMSHADFDRDGDLDLAVAQRPGSYVLVNDGGEFRPVAFEDVGLPARCWGVQWLDYDNDGRMDLFTQPGGLFRGQGDGTFAETGLLVDDERWRAFAWGDLDGDGLLDLVRPSGAAEGWDQTAPGLNGEAVEVAQAPAYTLAAYRNETEDAGDWLQVDLRGTAGNPQAIGATVLLETDGWSELAAVGQYDSSWASCGHYRLYFGLGESDLGGTDVGERVVTLTIHWPDGHRQVIRDVALNRRIEVNR